MKRILITGATGNVGREVIRFLYENNTQDQILAGVRNVDKARNEFATYPRLEFVQFNFEDAATFDAALQNVDCIFLLRPPHISDIGKFFSPLVQKIKEKNITQVVFLSVQGAEKSTIIPHNKIEKLITENGLDFIFLRPGYFMQNLTTTLLKDIQEKQKILLPAGKAKFNWIAIENIAEVAALVLNEFERHKNQVIELTGYENLNFYQVTDLINATSGKNITYDNANPFRFCWIKQREGLSGGLVFVMMMLHYLPRFQAEPVISGFYEQLTGRKPLTLKEFLQREMAIVPSPEQP